MAQKFERYFIRNLEKRPLAIETLEKVLTNDKHRVRLEWGGSYVNFIYTKTVPIEIDEEVMNALEWVGESNFIIEGGLRPTDGTASLFSSPDPEDGIFKVSVEPKVYTFRQFCLLSQSATHFVMLNAPGGSLDEFCSVKIVCYPDYPKMVTDLEERGWLATFPSTNILRVDERRFTFKKIVGRAVPYLQSYVGKAFEVDSLGTRFYQELSESVEKIWSSHLKDRVSLQKHGEAESAGPDS